jgi:hypothetical protein
VKEAHIPTLLSSPWVGSLVLSERETTIKNKLSERAKNKLFFVEDRNYKTNRSLNHDEIYRYI